MSDPWSFGMAAFQFLAWVMVWVAVVLVATGVVILTFAVLVGFARWLKGIFKPRERQNPGRHIQSKH